MTERLRVVIVLANVLFVLMISAKLHASQLTQSLCVKLKVAASCRVSVADRLPDISLDRLIPEISKNVNGSCTNALNIKRRDLNQNDSADGKHPAMPVKISYEASADTIVITIEF